MATKKKVEKGTVEEGLSMLIEMETNELQMLLSFKKSITAMCSSKKDTLILFGKMTGLDTSMLESLKVD